MTKSLGSLLSRAEGRLAPLLRLHVHASTQQMAQGDLVPVLHRADKKKRGIVTHLLQVWDDCSRTRPTRCLGCVLPVTSLAGCSRACEDGASPVVFVVERCTRALRLRSGVFSDCLHMFAAICAFGTNAEEVVTYVEVRDVYC